MDKEPDQDSAGSRHKECTVCGEVLETEELEKLYVSSTTDEHGEAVVGRYLVIVTDTDSKAPVSGAAVELGGEEHLSIRLPDRRLLDYADQTTITVLLAEPETPVEELAVSVTDQERQLLRRQDGPRWVSSQPPVPPGLPMRTAMPR